MPSPLFQTQVTLVINMPCLQFLLVLLKMFKLEGETVCYLCLRLLFYYGKPNVMTYLISLFCCRSFFYTLQAITIYLYFVLFAYGWFIIWIRNIHTVFSFNFFLVYLLESTPQTYYLYFYGTTYHFKHTPVAQQFLRASTYIKMAS